MCYLTSWVLSTAHFPSLLKQTQDSLCCYSFPKLLLSVKCITAQNLSAVNSFSSLKSSTSLEIFFPVHTSFFQAAWETDNYFPSLFTCIFFPLLKHSECVLKSEKPLNFFKTHHQPLQYPQEVHVAERPESHCACNSLKAEGVYCYGFLFLAVILMSVCS